MSDELPVPSTGTPEPAVSLRDEHTVLRREVATRAEAVLREADQDRWPDSELTVLVDYLQVEVLRQIVDEEWLLFRAARHARDKLAQLRGDHLELRLSIDELTQAAVGPTTRSPATLAAVTRHLLTQIDAHLAAEETVFTAAENPAPSTASLGSQPHEWYPLMAGPIIDLDQLPGPQGADAACDRLLRLRTGERVQLRSADDPSPLVRRVWRSDPAGYSVTYLELGPPRWAVEVIRRPPEPPLSPAAG